MSGRRGRLYTEKIISKIMTVSYGDIPFGYVLCAYLKGTCARRAITIAPDYLSIDVSYRFP
jgi:hypothetical protein